MTAAVILRQRKVQKRPVVQVWERSELPKLTGYAEEIAFARQIRAKVCGNLRQLAVKWSQWYRLVSQQQKGALISALEDVLHELVCTQSDAAWWINNADYLMAVSRTYFTSALDCLKEISETSEGLEIFNRVTMAYGLFDQDAKKSKIRVETTEIQGVVCARLTGSTGWISLE